MIKKLWCWLFGCKRCGRVIEKEIGFKSRMIVVKFKTGIEVIEVGMIPWSKIEVGDKYCK